MYPVLWNGLAGVEKNYLYLKEAETERELYATLGGKLPLPQILSGGPDVLVTEYLPFPHLLDVLKQQEHQGFQPEPWKELAEWLLCCYVICGKLPANGNLRNFLWDQRDHRIIGIDLEEYRPQTPEECGGSFTAYIRQYDPTGTPVKENAARLIAQLLGVSVSAQETAQNRLLQKREVHKKTPITGVVLAGGHSSRMGRSKPLLPLMGKTLVEWQVAKLRKLGAQKILISGPKETAPPGTYAVLDAIPERGPLGGLYTCFREAEAPQCIVLTGDMPLVPVQALYQMIGQHRSGITLLSHQGKTEPLIAVYDSALGEKILPLIQRAGAPVRRLLEQCEVSIFDYQGPEGLLLNCNTPEEYERVQKIAKAYYDAGVLLE